MSGIPEDALEAATRVGREYWHYEEEIRDTVQRILEAAAPLLVADAVKSAAAEERDRIAKLAGEHEAQFLIDRGDHADFRAFADLIREQS